jgi:hypothetical protein
LGQTDEGIAPDGRLGNWCQRCGSHCGSQRYELRLGQHVKSYSYDGTTTEAWQRRSPSRRLPEPNQTPVAPT